MTFHLLSRCGLLKLYSANNLKFLDTDASSDLLRDFFGDTDASSDLLREFFGVTEK